MARRATSAPALDSDVARRWTGYLDRIGAGDGPRASLARLERGAACVVTGQQAGVLTGPLLTILKAARAVSLARALEQESGRPVVPVFWIAGDDHDLDEIHHTFVLNRAGEPQKLRLELGGARGAAGEVPVPLEAAQKLVEEAWLVGGIDAAALSPEPFRPRAGDSLATWFGRCLLELLGSHGLVPLEPVLLARAARGVFERALDDEGAIARALEQGAQSLRERGIAPPLAADSEMPLFLIEPGTRTRVRRNGRAFSVGERTCSREALLEMRGPDTPRLSANVALRPIVQASCLPALAYVAGPNEIQYYEQLRPLHDLFDVPFPALVPRPQAVVLSVAASRALRKLGVAPAALLASLTTGMQGMNRSQGTPTADSPSPLAARGAELRAEVKQFVDELLATSPAVKSAAERRAVQLMQSFDAVLERAAAAQSHGAETAGVRWSLLENLVRPRGKPQDRTLNVLPFFAQHGPALVDAFLRLRGEPDDAGVVPVSVVETGNG